MTLTLCGARRARLAGAGAVLTGALALALGAPAAQAAFTTTPCLGAAVTGNGASFQNTAQNSLWAAPTGSFAAYCTAIGATAPAVTYTGGGSGAGISAMKNRDAVQRFAGTDDPLSTDDIIAINNGKAAAGDEGKIRTIPVAIGANAVIVNVPNVVNAAGTIGAGPACVVPSGLQTDSGDVDRARLRLTQTQVEGIFSGAIATWGALVPGIANPSGDVLATLSASYCSSFPITRVVRLDSSGTTFVQKDFLSTLAPATWNPLKSTVEAINTAWPQVGQLYTFDYNSDGDTADAGEANQPQLRRGSTAGNGGLVSVASTIDGSIGYSDLATARSGASGKFVRGAGADDTYWAEVGKPGDPGSYTDPATDQVNGFTPAAGADPAKKGSNCASAVVTGIPAGDDPTLLSWSAASVGNTGSYGICGITYGLAFDDYKGVYSSAAGYNEVLEEQKARTVKDYLTSIIGGISAGGGPFNQGQTDLSKFDYSPLPAASGGLRDIAKAAVAAIDWGKAPTGGGGGGGNTGGGGTTDGGAATTTTTTTPAAVTAPSNAFTFSKPRASSGNVLLTLQVPGAGAISVKATVKVGRRTITFATGKATRAAGGTAKLTLKPTTAAKRALKKSKHLKVSLSITFTPTGGTAKTTKSSLTVTAPKARK